MNIAQIKISLENQGHPRFRFNQLLTLVLSGANEWSECTTWPSTLRDEYAKQFPFISWTKATTSISQDGTVKALLTLVDGNRIETVLMQPKPGHWSVCVSCEVGCPMNCAFCATGKMGFIRKLTTEEITDQVLFWINYISHLNPIRYPLITIKSVVFMGMGEPFHNSENVFPAIEWLNSYYGLGARHISVSTSGIPDGIEKLCQLFPQVNLAISLHGATNQKRSSLMPINQQYSLDDLYPALRAYLHQTNRQLMFEYLLISKINDTKDDQQDLIAFLSRFPKNLIHVNLIRYNQTTDIFTATPIATVKQWKHNLIQNGISASIRKNLGVDIRGACGQLAGSTQ